MLQFLKAAGVIAAMFMLIPLTVWAGTGSRAQAWYALKEYLLVMGILCTVGGVAALVTLIP
jgi:hypothetical protein